MKDLKDYLHLYLNSEIFCLTPNGKGKLITLGMLGLFGFGMSPGYKEFEAKEVKPILRRLSSMTEEEWKDIFRLAKGVYSDSVINDFRKMSTTEISVRQGFAQYNLSHHLCYDNDVRLGYSVSFSMTGYKVLNKLNVGSDGLGESQSEFNEPELMIVRNQVLIFHYLLKKGFDLFNLIDEVLAIDATTLETKN